MDSTTAAAILGFIGVVLGAFLQAILPGSRLLYWLTSKRPYHSLIGDWNSHWGPLPEGPVQQCEVLTVAGQRGVKVWGSIKMDAEPTMRWKFEGRYDGQILQLYYYPSPDALDTDSLDYGCYFLRRRTDGSFVGYSIGIGVYENPPKDNVYIDYHVMKRR